eukprot:Pgem_evm2s9094
MQFFQFTVLSLGFLCLHTTAGQASQCSGLNETPTDNNPCCSGYAPSHYRYSRGDSLHTKCQKLKWQDEFDFMDYTKWTVYEGNNPSNVEKQYYANKEGEYHYVKDGVLNLVAKRNPVENNPYDWVNRSWTSARLDTLHKHGFLYGRIETRVRTKDIKGAFSAVWMLGAGNGGEKNWPANGEIDIMEYHWDFANTPNKIAQPQTLHMPCCSEGQAKSYYGTVADVVEWTTFTIDWYPDRIEFISDGFHHETYHKPQGKDLLECPHPNANWCYSDTKNPFFLIVNMAIGAEWGSQPPADVNEMLFEVDYIRIFENGATDGTAEPPTTATPSVPITQPSTSSPDCLTVKKESDHPSCFADITFAMSDGIHGHPEWYEGSGLTGKSSMWEFQDFLFKSKKCPKPCEDI